MSTVREHIQELRGIASMLEQRGESGHGNRQNNPYFQFAAVLLCGVHLDELEAMVNDRRPPADLTDMQIKRLVEDTPELSALDYGAAYLLVRKIEAAAHDSPGAPTGQSRTFETGEATCASNEPDEQETSSVSQGMAQDAARYRWLRDESNDSELAPFYAGEALDAAIDAAMRPQPTGERE